MKQVFGMSARYGELDSLNMRYNPPLPDVPLFVACPLARGSMGYEGIAEKDVYDMLAEVERQFPIDADRVYLTGISMGGGGALRLALTRPDLWAAVLPVCAASAPGLEELAPNAPEFAHKAGARRTRPRSCRCNCLATGSAGYWICATRWSISNRRCCATMRGTPPIGMGRRSSGSATFAAIAFRIACAS